MGAKCRFYHEIYYFCTSFNQIQTEMEIKNDFLRNNDLGLLLLRLSVGGLMLFHGIHKLVFEPLDPGVVLEKITIRTK